MASIRDEIHEIQSRRSRANSTGRSPYPKRKESARGAGAPKGPPPVQHKWNGNASQDSILGNGGGGGAGGREVPFEIPTRRAPNGSPAAAAPTDAYNNSKNGALPPSGSSKRDFVQSSNTPTTTTHSSSSHRYQHSNSSRGGTPLAQRLRDERSGQVVLLSRASDSEPDVGSPMTNTRDSTGMALPPTSRRLLRESRILEITSPESIWTVTCRLSEIISLKFPNFFLC